MQSYRDLVASYFGNKPFLKSSMYEEVPGVDYICFQDLIGEFLLVCPNVWCSQVENVLKYVLAVHMS